MLTREVIESLRTELAFKKIITANPQLIEILHHIKCAASQDINILLLGETGTGKDLCAEAIHFLSSRRDKPFIALNCGLGPLELFDSVLFGHVRGAFTNAINDHPGLVEEADKGILFLDEINSMPPAIQIKLNRFLMTGEFRRLGENKLRNVDVRIIAASNQPLTNAIEKNIFREDLFYRIAEYVIELPPLRKHIDDIPLLMDHFLKIYAASYHKNGLKFGEEVYQKAKKYHWPGNVRELENIIKRSIIDCTDNIIKDEDFQLPETNEVNRAQADYLTLPLHEAKIKIVNNFEIDYLHHQLQKYHGNVEECARQSKKHHSAFWALLKKHNIDPRKYRR